MIVKEADYPFEQYELKMIQHNDIPCLLQFQVIITDGNVEYWYDVTGMQSLEKQYSFDAVGQAQLCTLLRSLIEMKSAMEEYLLDDGNICFLTSFIYYDRFSGKLRFCYIPGLKEQKLSGLQGLFEEILQQLNHADPVAVRMGYDMYERCVQSEFVVSDCVECLLLCQEEIDDGGQNQQKKDFRALSYGDEAKRSAGSSADSDCFFEEEGDLEFLVDTPVQKRGRRRKAWRSKKKKIDYGKILEEEQTILYAAEGLDGMGKTELFSEEDMVKTWELVYKGDGLEHDLLMADFPFLIGTDDRRVNGVMQSRTVSRVHAGFSLQEDKLFLEDYNSTNGTYLNRKLVPMNTPVEVQEGDRVAFATEEYAVSCRRSSAAFPRKQRMI
ncbi:MAG: FHA domain-containing protein [Clostridiales bacterium]|nr:FHA domain-containing protein [Clostridiales bacterium]